MSNQPTTSAVSNAMQVQPETQVMEISTSEFEEPGSPLASSTPVEIPVIENAPPAFLNEIPPVRDTSVEIPLAESALEVPPTHDIPVAIPLEEPVPGTSATGITQMMEGDISFTVTQELELRVIEEANKTHGLGDSFLGTYTCVIFLLTKLCMFLFDLL